MIERDSSGGSTRPPAKLIGGHFRAARSSVSATRYKPASATCSKLAARSARRSATEPEELPLGVGWRYGGRALVGGRGLAVSAEPPEQIGSGGVEGLVVVQVQFVDQSERCRGALNLADRDGSVEGNDRRGGDRKQLVVQGDDLRPVGLFECGSVRVHGVDGGLQLVRAGLVAAEAATDDRLSFLDQGAIPTATVLLAEQRKAAVRANARCAAGLAQEQQRQQAGYLRLVGQKGREDPRQADRLGAETGFGLAGLPGGIDEVDDGEHGTQA